MQLVYKNHIVNWVLAAAALFLSSTTFGSAASGSLDLVVSEAYKQYPVEPNPNANYENNNLQVESIEILRKYFTNEVALAIRGEYDTSLRTHMLGALSFDILYSSQDPYAKDLKVEKISDSEAKACYKNQDESKTCLIFLGEKEGDTYKIRDIKFPMQKETLRHLLKLPS